MEDLKITFKTQYIGNSVKFTADFNFPLSRKEIKGFKDTFLLPHKEKLTQYKNAIDKFTQNHKEFIMMLQQSNTKYKQLPFKGEDKEYKKYLDVKSTVIKDRLNEYSIKKELRNMDSLTGLTDFEKKNITRSRKRALINEHSETQKEHQRSNASRDEYNRTLRRNFTNSQWREYNRFFVQNPAFRKVFTQIVKDHLKEEYSIEMGKILEYSFKDDLVLIMRDMKKINRKFRERSINFRKELFAKIERWDNKSEQKFFPSIFTNSNFGLRINKSLLELTFDIKMMYDNILKFVYEYYSLEYPQSTLSITKDKSCAFDSYLFIIGLPRFLETEGMESLISYSMVKEKSTFRFNFESVLKELCRNVIKDRKTLMPVPPSTLPLKEKILKKVKIAVPISAIVIIILVVSFLFINIPSVIVEKYDSVKLDYTVWVSDEDENYDELNPDVGITIWLTVIPITENESTGLVLGLYNNVLGKKVKFDSGLIWLNKCIDQDRDGIDDNTGQIALTYGNSTDLYFNTCLMIHFKILDIQKSSPSFFWDVSDNILIYIIGLILVIIGSVFLLMRTGIFISDRVQKRRLKPKLVFKTPRTRKFSLIKYGTLAISIPLLLLGVVGIINIAMPLPEIILSSKYNPFVLPTLIGLMVGICVIYIPIFLVASNVLYDKIHKKQE